MMRFILIEPRSWDPDAIDATEASLAALPRGGRFQRDPNGRPILQDGLLVLECQDPRFIAWAAVHQGYVMRALQPEEER